MNIENYNKWHILINSILLLIVSIYSWINEILEESYFHNIILKYNLYLGFILFVISEIMLFLSLFISYFYNNEIYIGITSINAYNIPLLNTAILYFSGITITISLLTKRKDYLLYTIILGIIFTILQVYEYYECNFSITDSFYGSIFYILTGLHGIHVIMGTIFLILTLKNIIYMKPSILYWHFVDYVWLILFICIYIKH
uniref:Cytochrome c oxidase subunit 3 n=1 Tax=Mitosporidium daphniae TaxID=1485682 RepID=A0A8F1SZJ6_9MICR|nr:cytochrome c oxidase subunit 3 [Mitosporidium daphniae]